MRTSSRILILAAISLIAFSCSVTKMIPAEYPVLATTAPENIGSLQSVVYPTSVPGPVERRMYVYLPEDYESTKNRYPVLYMLHGARGSEASWINEGNILNRIDSLTKANAIRKMIVVFPNMNSYDSDADYAKSRRKGGWESFFEVDGVVETSFVKDVVGATDSIFRTVPKKEARAIAGLSLGGMQAMYISASSPDVFGYVGILSAPVHSALKKGEYSSFYDGIETKIDKQFSEAPLLYNVYVGKKDIYRNTMEKFCKELESKGYDCNFKIDEGGHQWPQWLSFASSFISDVNRILPDVTVYMEK